MDHKRARTVLATAAGLMLAGASTGPALAATQSTQSTCAAGSACLYSSTNGYGSVTTLACGYTPNVGAARSYKTTTHAVTLYSWGVPVRTYPAGTEGNLDPAEAFNAVLINC